MASFLINSSNQSVVGTEDNDLFLIQTALNSNVQGLGGRDQFTGSANNVIATTLQGGLGNDTIIISADAPGPFNGDFINSFIGGGGDNDLVITEARLYRNATINGGGGDDTLRISANEGGPGENFGTGSVLNGNGGKDFISGEFEDEINNAFIGGGGDNDIVDISADESASYLTLAGGGGSDVISASMSAATGILVEGDTLADSEFFGNDTIRLEADRLSFSYVGAGGGADSIVISASGGTSTTVGGGNGRDTIKWNGTAGSALRINGGAAGDNITFSGLARDTSVSIFGGGANDTITISGSGFAGALIGGVGEDKFNLGEGGEGGEKSQYGGGLHPEVTYLSAGDASVVGAFDFVSAEGGTSYVGQEKGKEGKKGKGGPGGFTAFQIRQPYVDAVVAAPGGNANFNIVTGGAATFTTGFIANLTARVEQLDSVLVKGSVASFNDGSRNYIFIQGGDLDAGIADDVVIRTDKQAVGFTISGTQEISVLYGTDV